MYKKVTKYMLLSSVLALFGFFAVMSKANAQIVTSSLSIGSSGEQVTALQQFLAQDPTIYPDGLVTGYYGQLTADAVTRFQAKYGISQVGIVGPITMAKINELTMTNSFADVNAPVISNTYASAGTNSVTFNWNTNEPATSKVYEGATMPFLYKTAPFVTVPGLSTGHSVTVQGLSPNTTGYYTLESVDASGNVSWTLETPVSTT